MTEPKECECCGFEGAELKPYREGFPNELERHYCDLCAGTYASTIGDNGPEGRLLISLCYIGNAIIQELRNNGGALHAIEQQLEAIRRNQ